MAAITHERAEDDESFYSFREVRLAFNMDIPEAQRAQISPVREA